MPEARHTGYRIDREKLDPDFPTMFQKAPFWEELGRTVAAFGWLEDTLAKAIFALTGTQEFDAKADPDAFDKWIKTLEKALTDQLANLITAYGKALAENERTKGIDHSPLIEAMRQAKDIRNVLCHGAWGRPDDNGRTVPTFVNRQLLVFETPIDIAFLQQTRAAVRNFICDVVDSVTGVGYKFPGSDGPGEQLWPHPSEIKLGDREPGAQ